MANYKVKDGAPIGINPGEPKLNPGDTFDSSKMSEKALAILEAKGRVEKCGGAAPKKAQAKADPAEKEDLSLDGQQAKKPKG